MTGTQSPGKAFLLWPPYLASCLKLNVKLSVYSVRQKHLVLLPASPTVEDILEEYVASRDAQPDPFVRTEFVQGQQTCYDDE